MTHWLTTYDPDDGEPTGTPCHCGIGDDHDGKGNLIGLAALTPAEHLEGRRP